jgi:hypothetical protein
MEPPLSRRILATLLKPRRIGESGDFFGEETIFAGVTVKNTGSRPMVYRYYVAFFDKDKNLIGAAAQGSFHDAGLKPGDAVQLGSCLINLPKNRFKDIAFYQAVIYESEPRPTGGKP